jgi:oligopeptide transport system substrate-binding protein
LLSACAKRESPVAEGIRTHTLLLGNQNEPATLDPHLVNAATDFNLSYALFEGLTVFDEKTAQPLPGVAERWDISPDGRIYTFHLRANARWSNGDRVTARDFAYSLQRQLTPALGSVYTYMLWPIKNAEPFSTGKLTDFSAVGVAVIDEATLQLTLERPTPYLLALAAHPTWMPVHRATVEKFGQSDDRSSPWTRPGRMVGNGAFVLAEWSPNARIVVTKNPHYWDAARNRLERVIFFPTEKADVEERDFRAGQLHITFSLPPSKVPVYRAQPNSPLQINPSLFVIYLNFNSTKPPFNHPKLRRALALAVDRAAIAERVYNGAGAPAGSVTPPHCGAYLAPRGQGLDYAAARTLLAEAGYPGGQGLPPLPMQVLNDDKQPKVAEAIQAMWQRELGVRLTIEPLEQKTWIQNQQTLTHTLGLMGWTADFPDPITFLDLFKTGGGNNFTGWSNPSYDALLDQAANTADPAARFAVLQKAEALLLDQAAVAPLIHGAETKLIHPAVKNWEPSPLAIHRYQLIDLRE